MEDEHRKLDLTVLTLACEFLDLSSALDKTTRSPTVSQSIKTTLIETVIRLQQMSNWLLSFRQELQFTGPSAMSNATAAQTTFGLLDILFVFKPLYPLCCAISDYGTGKKKEEQTSQMVVLTVEGFVKKTMDRFDKSICEICDVLLSHISGASSEVMDALTHGDELYV